MPLFDATVGRFQRAPQQFAFDRTAVHAEAAAAKEAGSGSSSEDYATLYMDVYERHEHTGTVLVRSAAVERVLVLAGADGGRGREVEVVMHHAGFRVRAERARTDHR